MKKNEIIELNIEDTTFEGSGVGRLENGMAVFVPGCAAGDRIRAKIVKAKKTYAFAIVDDYISLSSDRQENDCDIYKKCGGCCFRHITYEAELKVKENTVFENLKKEGIQAEISKIIPSPNITGYRNKAQLPIRNDADGNISIGFYAKRSHRVVNLSHCHLHPEFFDDIVEYTRRFVEKYNISAYNEVNNSGLLRHLYIRYGEESGEIMVCLVINGRKLPNSDAFAAGLINLNKNIKSIMLNVNTEKTNVILGRKNILLYGTPYINDILCGNKYHISPTSFYQVNRSGAEKLYNLAAEMAGLSGNETVLDLYCGVGTIGLSVANKVKKVIGVEIVPDAVEDAKRNAQINNIQNAEFICSDAAAAADALLKRGERPDIVIVDPPRKGCSNELLETISKLSPEKIIMISCNSATMARDIRLIEQAGYKLGKVQPVDMFPRTAHVETVCLLSKLNTKQHIEINLDMDELDLTDAEKKATYQEIKDYVLEHSGLKVSSLYIAQVKQKCGIIERENYNKPKSEDAKQPQCPPDKEKAIKEALKHFGMI